MSRHRALHSTTVTTGVAERRRRLLLAAVPVLVVASTVVACTSSAPPAPRTAKVERTSVTSGVSAAGSLAALDEANVGFPTGGQLTAVDVKVGDHVTAGQVLATIDGYAAKQALRQAQAQLAAQQSVLAGITANPSIGNSQDSLDQAREVLGRTKDQAGAVQDADQVAIDNAERQLKIDQDAQHDAEDKQDSDCPDGDPGTSAPTAAPSAPSMGSVLGITGMTTSTSTCTAAVYAADKSAVTAARRAVAADEGVRDAAGQKKTVDDTSSDLAAANAEQAVVSAQNGVNSATAARPSSIGQQNAAVANAQAAVATAQRGVDNTTLRAPAAGTVTAVNGAVGEFLSPTNSTSALAPGSDASIPGASGASGSAAAGAAAAATPSRPGGTQFIVLDDLDQYQVVLPFGEADAASISPGQKVQATFDAVPDLTVPGTVLAVGPAGTALAGVISYYVTVTLPQSDPRLKAGMTAHGEIVTSEVPGVLTVPSAAVHQQNGTSTVTVLGADGAQRTATVTIGAVGDGRTQVKSGLNEGDAVVLPPTP